MDGLAVAKTRTRMTRFCEGLPRRRRENPQSCREPDMTRVISSGGSQAGAAATATGCARSADPAFCSRAESGEDRRGVKPRSRFTRCEGVA
jgi:hypothetical protein